MLLNSKMAPKFLAIWLIVVLFGCFTEVGNAEGDKIVSADFTVDYSEFASIPVQGVAKQQSLVSTHISQFALVIKEAEFHNTHGREGHLWNEDSLGVIVDFTGNNQTQVLPNAKFNSDTIRELEFECVMPRRDSVQMDTVDIDNFHQSGFIKGTLSQNGKTVAFLFALPKIENLKLLYKKPVLDAWLSDKGYDLQIVFYANKWAALTNLASVTQRKDKKGKDVVFLDHTHNPSEYTRLVTSFYASFNTTIPTP